MFAKLLVPTTFSVEISFVREPWLRAYVDVVVFGEAIHDKSAKDERDPPRGRGASCREAARNGRKTARSDHGGRVRGCGPGNSRKRTLGGEPRPHRQGRPGGS